MKFNRKFDLDVAALKPGDVIPTTQLIDLLGRTPENRYWGLRVQALKIYIEQKRADIVCREIDAALHILEDDAKPEYLLAQYRQGMMRCAKAATYMETRVDHRKLTPERAALVDSAARIMTAANEAHERALGRNARISALLGIGDSVLPAGEE